MQHQRHRSTELRIAVWTVLIGYLIVFVAGLTARDGLPHLWAWLTHLAGG